MKKKIIAIIVILICSIAAIYLIAYFNVDVKVENSKVEYGLKEENFKRDVTLFGKSIGLKTSVTNKFSFLSLGNHKIKITIKLGFIEFKTIEQEITIVDTNKPTIKLLGKEKVTIKAGEEYTEEGYSAEDIVDGDLTSKVKVTNNINNKKAGTYEITYTVYDSNNIKTSIKREVVVGSINQGSNDVTELTYIDGILIVNKKYGLPSSYAPFNNKEAENALAKLRADAGALGYSYKYNCGYRSYNDQRIIYNGYVRDYGQEEADTFSAMPGHSEHQTGLAFDIGEFSESFGSTKEGLWLANNAHKYGFIIRYPKGKENITGYSYEPWHIRYLGVDIATKVYESGLTLEEYLNID